MEQAAVALEAIGESIVFLDHFKELPDPRQRGKITYPLGEVLLLRLLAVLGGAETFVRHCRSSIGPGLCGARKGKTPSSRGRASVTHRHFAWHDADRHNGIVRLRRIDQPGHRWSA
jgi:hypothetical protein